MKSIIDSVQLMRGIAALSVVFCHLIIFDEGNFGVDLFFCISGFIMMLVTEKNYNGFLQKRFLRICPLYFLLTIGKFSMGFIMPNLLRDPNISVTVLLRSFLFIGGNEIMVGVGWTLCYEMFFYFLFFLAFKINHKNRHIIATLFLAIIVLIGLLVKNTNEYFLFYTQPIILEFAFGIWAYKFLYSNFKIAKSKLMESIFIIAAISIYSSLFFIKLPVNRLISAGIPTFIVFILFFISLENHRIPKFFIVLGNISYSLYLTHTFVITAFSKLIIDIEHEITPLSILGSVIAICFSLGVAYTSWYLIENKLTNWIKNKVKL